jgi:plastocyanin
MFKRTILAMTLIVLSALGLTACGGGASAGGSSSASAVNITVTATEFKFDPATINAAPGQTINLTFTNKGSIQHTWVLPAANVKFTVDAGKSDTKTFTAPTAPGTYPIDCDIAGHKEAGMTGQLIVK